VRSRPVAPQKAKRSLLARGAALAGFGLYKILFHFEAFVHKSIILLCPPPSHLHSPYYCNTIARLLRNIRRLFDPPLVCHTPYNIGDGNIV